MNRRFVVLGTFAIAFMLLFGAAYVQHSYGNPYYDRFGNPEICGYDYYGNPYYCNYGYGDGYNYGYGPYWNGYHHWGEGRGHEWREHHERGEHHEGGEHHHDRD